MGKAWAIDQLKRAGYSKAFAAQIVSIWPLWKNNSI
jgi:hypothetical protein